MWGEELYFDSTKVQANASMESLLPRFAVEAHLEKLFEDEKVLESEEGTSESTPNVGVEVICPRPRTKSSGTQRRKGGPLEEYVDLVRAYRGTEPYQKALGKRAVWVEPLFGEAKANLATKCGRHQ